MHPQKLDAAPLLQPGRIGPLALENRVVMAPMTTRKADREGFVTDETIAYYKARARGGVGLIIVEMASPESVGRHRHFELGIFDDRFLPGLTRLVETIHAEGAKAAIQLGHGGGHTRLDICGETPIAPSALPHSVQEGHTEIIVPEAMDEARIRRSVEAFAQAAQRARSAGFDAVEIHGAHGYLISQFLTPAENIREDGYGGALRHRARFSCEITRAVKTAVPDLAVIFRMNGDDFFAGGIQLGDAAQVAEWVAESGADAIHMTGGHYRSTPTAAIMIPPMWTDDTPFLKFAEEVKGRVRVPVIAVGRMGRVSDASQALAAGKADFIALGRPLLADPDWVRKAAEGQPVRQCLACNSCVDGMREGRELYCIVNPVTGRETLFDSRSPVRKGQKIAVIGAGPAGLSYAALMAADNQVTVFERDAVPGGAFRLVGLAPLFQNVQAREKSFAHYIESLRSLCMARGVAFRLSHDAMQDPSALTGFDHVVIAAGAGYRWGVGGLVTRLLRSGLLQKGILRRLASNDRLRDWFYHRLREGRGTMMSARLSGAFSIEIIGDAARAGKSERAIQSAYEAAYGVDLVTKTKVGPAHDG